MKTCTKCNQSKNTEDFSRDKNRPDGLYPQCRICKSGADKQYYTQNKKKIINSVKSYYENNKDLKKEYYEENKEKISEYNKEYKKLKKDKIKEYNRLYKQQYREKRNQLRLDRKKSDPIYKLCDNIRSRIAKCIKKNGYTKNAHLSTIIGCSFEDLKIHIESKFKDEMRWDNHGTYWHLDHIIPLDQAKTEEDVYRLNHYTNLQPLKIEDNLQKSNKFDNSVCWQKQIRDMYLIDDIKKGFPTDAKVSDFVFQEESFTKEHHEFIKRYEWLGTIGFGVKYCFTARYNGLLGGVVLISEPNAYEFDMKTECLIQRGACASWTPKNLGSSLVMFSCRWCVVNTQKRIFVAYSDPEAGEIGTIYQACNFDYLGNNYGASFKYKLKNGKLVSDRYFSRTSSVIKYCKELGIEFKEEWLKDNGFQDITKIPNEIKDVIKEKVKHERDKCEKVRCTPKGKYVLLLKNNKREAISKLWESLPYPKRTKQVNT